MNYFYKVICIQMIAQPGFTVRQPRQATIAMASLWEMRPVETVHMSLSQSRKLFNIRYPSAWCSFLFKVQVTN